MPFSPTIIQGLFGKWHVDELSETGLLTKGVNFSLDSATMDTKAHVSAAALNQIVRSRTDVSALMIDFDGEAILDGNGQLTGLANVYAGKNIAVCAHFAADVLDTDGISVTVAGRTIFGFTRDADKYLQVQDPTADLSPENPAAIKFKARYLPQITATSASS